MHVEVEANIQERFLFPVLMIGKLAGLKLYGLAVDGDSWHTSLYRQARKGGILYENLSLMRRTIEFLAAVCFLCVFARIATAATAKHASARSMLDHPRIETTAAAASSLPQVFEWIFSTDLPANTCTRPNPVDYFSTAATSIDMWIYLSGARTGDDLEVDYTLPGGSTGSIVFKPYDQAGNYCNTFSLPLIFFQDSDRIGDWSFQILINKTQIGTAGTVVIGPAQPLIDGVEAYGNAQLSALSPGALAIVRGANLAASVDSAQGAPLPPSLGGAAVTMNGVIAPIFHAEPTALYVQVPAGIRADSAAVRVSTDLGGSNRYRMPLRTVSPALVPDDSTPSQAQLFRVSSDGSFARVSSDVPLQRGDTAVLVTSGLGATLNPPRDGDRGGDNSACAFIPVVSIGHVSAPVTGCFLGDFPGLYWVYAQVPTEVGSGAALPVQLRVNGIDANVLTVPILGPGPSFPAIAVSRVEHPLWNGSTRDDKQYDPTSLVAITATNLRPNAPAYMECSDQNGFDGLSAALKVTETYAIFTAPFYIDTRTGDYTSGSVSCVLGQTLADSTVVSSPFSITIQAPLKATGNPGAVTLALVQAASQGARRIQADLTMKQSAGGGNGFSASNTRAQMDNIAATYAPYLDALKKVSSGSQQSVTLDTAANGTAMVITRDALARTDRWIATMLRESHISTINNEEFQPPPLRVHTSSQTPRASILGTITGLLRECVNIPGYISYAIGQIVGTSEPDPSEACAALAKVPQAAADSVVQATEEVAHDLSRVAEVAAIAAIPVGAEVEAAAVLARMGAVNNAIQVGAAAVDHVIALVSPNSPERSEILQRTGNILTSAAADFGTDKVNDLLKQESDDLFGNSGAPPYELGHELVDLRNEVKAETDDLAQLGAEVIAPALQRNADGSVSLAPDALPTLLNTISGKIFGSDAPLSDGWVELGDGDRISTPYGVGVVNPDGSYSVEIPKEQVGNSIPPSLPLQFDIRDPSGTNDYKSYSGPTPIQVGQSQTLPDYKLPTSGGGGSGGGNNGGGTCLYACRAD
jgi:uncharacterized protein (TIGR03437 family)